jgi:hypothetical protein
LYAAAISGVVAATAARPASVAASSLRLGSRQADAARGQRMDLLQPVDQRRQPAHHAAELGVGAVDQQMRPADDQRRAGAAEPGRRRWAGGVERRVARRRRFSLMAWMWRRSWRRSSRVPRGHGFSVAARQGVKIFVE